jgi:hypothetical protein
MDRVDDTKKRPGVAYVDEVKQNRQAKWTGWMKRLEKEISVGRMDDAYKKETC